MSSGRKLRRALLIGGLILFSTAVLLIAINPFFLYLPLLWTGIRVGPRHDAAFLEAHQRAINSFVEIRGFGTSRLQDPRFWNDRTVTFNGRIYAPNSIHLIGLTPERGERYFDVTGWPAKKELTNVQPRSLSEVEAQAVLKLRGEVPFVAITDSDIKNTIRLFAPIKCQVECQKCHPVADGTTIGAFVYSLTIQE